MDVTRLEYSSTDYYLIYLSELKVIDLVSILFSFYFLLFLLKSRRQRRQSVTQSQKSHAHMIQGNNVEDSRKVTS